MTSEENGFRERVTRQSEETIAKLAHDVLQSPLVSGTISAAFDARERASRAQEMAMGALNLPSAGDIERLTRRLRSVSQRLEALEEGIEGISDRLDELSRQAPQQDVARAGVDIEKRLAAIEGTLARLEQKPG